MNKAVINKVVRIGVSVICRYYLPPSFPIDHEKSSVSKVKIHGPTTRKIQIKTISLILRGLSWLVIGFITLSVLLVVPFAWFTPPTSSVMLQNEFYTKTAGRQQWVALEQMSPYLALAAIAAEDQRFPEHGGFDFIALKQVLAERRQGKPLRGASTISQQTAKNLYLWPQRSLLRKGLEAWFTMLMEIFWSKRRVLEIYLNIVQFTEHTYGVEAASRHFFDKPAQAITREQAALLIAVLPAPNRYRVDAPSDYLIRRQQWILQQMRQLGGLNYLKNL
jgi:monofunctional biosynthetic peptidoglycan transglycosylase